MWNALNSRFFAAILITFGLPAMLYVVAVTSSQSIANSVVAGLGDSLAAMAQGQNKKTVQDIVSGFTTQLIAGLKQPFSEMQKDQQSKQIQEVEILNSLKVENVKTVPSEWGGDKVIGTVTNTSDKPIQQIQLSISAYDASGALQNVSSEYLSTIKVLKPKQSTNFGISPSILRPGKDQPYVAPARIDVMVSNFSIMETQTDKAIAGTP